MLPCWSSFFGFHRPLDRNYKRAGAIGPEVNSRHIEEDCAAKIFGGLAVVFVPKIKLAAVDERRGLF
jgi:hypothetical protein